MEREHLRTWRSIQCLIASDTLLGHCGTDDSWFANFHVPADLGLREFGSVRYDLQQLASERCGYKLLSLVVALQYHAMKLNPSLAIMSGGAFEVVVALYGKEFAGESICKWLNPKNFYADLSLGRLPMDLSLIHI